MSGRIDHEKEVNGMRTIKRNKNRNYLGTLLG